MTNTTRIALATTLLVAGATAQKIASYDPAAGAGAEYAAVACDPLPPLPVVDGLNGPPAAATWWFGAIAADNRNERLYSTTGFAPNGIQARPFADIGSGAVPFTFPAPPGFNQISAMVMDPRFPAGDRMFVSDGFVIAEYHLPTATILAVDPSPAGTATFTTGLAWDPFNDRIMLVDANSNLYWKSILGGPWNGPIPPIVATPARATGLAFCQTKNDKPWVSYFGGAVLEPQSGNVLPFPGAPAGPRRHRGLTLIGRTSSLGGAGLPALAPTVEVQNGFWSDDPATQVDVNTGGLTFLLLDIAPTFAPVPVAAPFTIHGTVYVSPATSASVVFGPGGGTLPLSLVGVPPGVGLTFQAAALIGGNIEMSDAVALATYLR